MYRNYAIVFLLSFFSYLLTLANERDSLRQVAESYPVTVSNVKASNSLGTSFCRMEILDSSIYYIDLSILWSNELISKTKDPAIISQLLDLRAHAYGVKGIIFYYRKNLDSAASYYRISNAELLKKGESKKVLFNSNNLGIIYFEQGKVQEALDVFLEVLNSKYLQKDSILLASVYSNISNSYDHLGDKKSAEEYFDKGIEIYMLRNDRGAAVESCCQRGFSLLQEQEYHGAYQFFIRAKLINEAVGSVIDEIRIGTSLGRIFVNVAKSSDQQVMQFNNKLVGGNKQDIFSYRQMLLDSALNFLSKAEDFLEEKNFKTYSFSTLQLLGEIYLEKGDKQKALTYYKKIEDILSFVANPEDEQMVYGKLHALYASQKKFKEAANYLKKYIYLEDSLMKARDLTRLQYANATYSTQKKKELKAKNVIEQEKVKNNYQSLIDGLGFDWRKQLMFVSGLYLLFLIGYLFLGWHLRKIVQKWKFTFFNYKERVISTKSRIEVVERKVSARRQDIEGLENITQMLYDKQESTIRLLEKMDKQFFWVSNSKDKTSNFIVKERRNEYEFVFYVESNNDSVYGYVDCLALKGLFSRAVYNKRYKDVSEIQQFIADELRHFKSIDLSKLRYGVVCWNRHTNTVSCLSQGIYMALITNREIEGLPNEVGEVNIGVVGKSFMNGKEKVEYQLVKGDVVFMSSGKLIELDEKVLKQHFTKIYHLEIYERKQYLASNRVLDLEKDHQIIIPRSIGFEVA